MRRRNHDELRERLRAGGFTPRASEVADVLRLLADEELGPKAMQAALAVPNESFEVARSIADEVTSEVRARLCELIGRIARGGDEGLVAWLISRVEDDDGRVRRRAIAALGKLENSHHEGILLAAWGRAGVRPVQPAARLAELRAIAVALGSCGRERARALLAGVRDGDEQLVRVATEAVIKIDRELARSDASRIDLDASLPGDTEVLLHVRPGLEAIVLDELGAEVETRMAGRGRVAVRGARSLRALFVARSFLHLGIPLAPRHIASGRGPEDAVIEAMTEEPTIAILRALTRGPIRWRLQWNDGGHRRAATFRVAKEVAHRRPELVNDARHAPWVAGVSERGSRVFIELWPRAITDPRFVWRGSSVPAASHPTVAAALARIGQAQPEDVVWDPFCGSGSELAERALLGNYRELHGSDLDTAALALARDNLSRAGVVPTTLVCADARTHRPSARPIDLLLTNPPLGFRVTSEVSQHELVTVALDHWCDLLAAGGRIVWVSPMPGLTAAHPRLRADLRLRVDLGGLQAEIQRLVLAPRSRRGC